MHLVDRGRSVGRAEDTSDKRIHLSDERGESAVEGTSFISLLKKIGVVADTAPYRLANSADVSTNLIRHFRQNRQALENFIAGSTVLIPQDTPFIFREIMLMFTNRYFPLGLENHLSDEQQLLNSLKHTVVQRRDDPASNSCAYAGESLITLLLKVDLVQPPLIRILFEKMPEFFDRDIDGCRTEDSIPTLMIHRLRWLDNLHKESDLTNKLIDMLEIAPLSLKREVVSALPDIVNDSEHQQLLPALQGILDSDPECTNAVIFAPGRPAFDSSTLSLFATPHCQTRQ